MTQGIYLFCDDILVFVRFCFDKIIFIVREEDWKESMIINLVKNSK